MAEIDFFTVGDAARQIGPVRGEPVNPRVVTELLYRRVLSERLCPLMGGRRMIHRSALPALRAAVEARVSRKREVATNG
jgi:hypothetical protein